MAYPWRVPNIESDDLYPGLSVNDGRVSGSIVVDHSRLPLWCFVGVGILHGWDEVESGWEPEAHYGWTAEKTAAFVHDLLEMRGEFGRLLLVLADAERCERARNQMGRPWWNTKRHQQRIGDQLRRCLAALEAEEPS